MSNNLNNLILEGVVVGEPHKEKSSKVLNFSIKFEHDYRNIAGEYVTESSQFNVVAFGRMCKLPVKEGIDVRIVGRLKQNTWEENGVTHSEVQIVAEHIEIKKTK